ncbi:MAG: hypothetical protein H6581_21280 [Bacteroidia bacterium]|nr:hypothetical protein [Bacteroidia bacterium]
MKTTLFSLAAGLLICLSGLFLPHAAKAQSLQFSRVILVQGAVADTVPAGKVWKVEAILTDNYYQSSGGSSCSLTYGYNKRLIQIDGQPSFIQGQGLGTGSTSVYMNGYSIPLWLPAGTTVQPECASTRLSVIEFTVVP